METIAARFDVTGFEPSTIPGVSEGNADDWVGAITMRKVFASGLVGTSVLHFVTSGAEPNRAFLAAERIAGRLDDGREGEFTVHHWGTQFGEEMTTDGVIIPGSGTGDFVDWAGRAVIHHDADGAYFEFTIT